mgnify:CR=1 FL=1
MEASGAIVTSGLSVAIGVFVGCEVAVGVGDADGFAFGTTKDSFVKVAVAVCVVSSMLVFVITEYWVMILFLC